MASVDQHVPSIDSAFMFMAHSLPDKITSCLSRFGTGTMSGGNLGFSILPWRTLAHSTADKPPERRETDSTLYSHPLFFHEKCNFEISEYSWQDGCVESTTTHLLHWHASVATSHTLLPGGLKVVFIAVGFWQICPKLFSVNMCFFFGKYLFFNLPFWKD